MSMPSNIHLVYHILHRLHRGQPAIPRHTSEAEDYRGAQEARLSRRVRHQLHKNETGNRGIGAGLLGFGIGGVESVAHAVAPPTVP